MTTFQLILIAGVVLGIVQLTAGVAIGLWMGRRKETAPSEESAQPANDQANAAVDTLRAQQLALDLQGLTTSVAASVERHAEQLTAIDQRLVAERDTLPGDQSASLTDLVVGVVGELLTANQTMQTDLCDARAALEKQSAEIAEHVERSLTDPLTKLPNRRALEEHLGTRVEAWRKHQTPFCVLMVDVDHFKKFNDTHGHAAGDAALVAVGQAMSGALRNHDVVTRYGGEEFALLLPYATVEELNIAVTKVLVAVAETEIETENGTQQVTISAGLAGIQPHERADGLMKRADKALYAAKANGRNRAYKHVVSDIVPLDSSAAVISAVEAAEQGLSTACTDLQQSLARFLDDEPTVEGSREALNP